MNFTEQIVAPDFAMPGLHLVAASAGTGKTYSIQTLYLRLVMVEGLSVQQILVVTFTKAATKELKERLQKVLREALDFQNDAMPKPDERIVKMAALAEAKAVDRKMAASRLAQALLDFDLAAIYTIHGFCQRMLGRFAFETGQAFDVEPSEASDAEIVECCRDWWRTNIVAAGAAQPDFGFKPLAAFAKRLAAKPDAELDGSPIAQAAEAVVRDYRADRPASRGVSFDDYLLNLRQALRDDGPGGPLHAALHTEFRAALVDEFQDTDPIQWGIFGDLFGERSDMPCFLVGDPKQAIYRFRNGDIETYVRATRDIAAEARHELDTNYRSESRLIAAVNQIFMDRLRNGVAYTFGHPAILYDKPLKAHGKKPAEALTVGGALDDQPLKLWFVPWRAKRAGVPGAASETARETYRIVAAGIAEILDDAEVCIAGAPVRPGQIAVLVHTHQEAEWIADELRHLGIPGIRQGTGSVWKTEEANFFWMLLKTVLNPQDGGSLRGILLSPWIGLTAADVIALNAGEARSFPAPECALRAIEDWVILFETWRETWRRRGFAAMLARAFEALGLQARLAALPDGLRRLANVAHLAERTQCEIAKERKSPEAALAWIQDMMTPGIFDDDVLRMESDDDAVRIMTVFASKGLEFPIVFAPTLYMLKSKDREGLYEYHNSATGALHITSDKTNGAKPEKDEVGVEHLRHIYVALTRAVHRTVLFSLPPEQFANANSPLTHLLDGAIKTPEKAEATFVAVTGEPAAVAVVDRRNGFDEGRVFQPPAFSVGAAPETPKINCSRGHGSFSSLVPHARGGSPAVASLAPDAAKNRDGETVAEDVATASENAPSDGIFVFPAGARTGTCWHEIFEEIPFDIGDAPLREVVAEKLDAFGFLAKADEAEGRREATFGMVRRVLDCVLPSEGGAHGGFALKSVAVTDRISEWEFHFPTPLDRRTTAIRAAIAGHERYQRFTDAVADWNRAIPGGYLTGFLDLLFRHDGRYYIVDWKSNRRGGRPTDFDAAGVREEIAVHGYWLQFLIYAVAVHQHLKATLPGYDYDRHFGGVYYLFLRGVDGRGGGVYADRPPQALVEELSRILGDFG